MKLPLEIIVDKIIQKYKLQYLAHQFFVYIEIQKGIYGLPQAGNIVNNKMKQRLVSFGYEPAPITPGLLWYQIYPLQFSLVMDDFGIQY